MRAKPITNFFHYFLFLLPLMIHSPWTHAQVEEDEKQNVASMGNGPGVGNLPEIVDVYRSLFDPRYMKFIRTLNASREQYNHHEAKRILFLGDKDTESYYSKAEKLAPKLPEVQIYKTDLEVDTEKEGAFQNLVVKKVDNTQPLPFEENYFDMVVLKNGLCHCWDGDQTCAGIHLSEEKMADFINETLRVFNKNNPKGFIVLHGPNYEDEKAATVLVGAARLVADKNPDVKVKIFRQKKWWYSQKERILGIRLTLKDKNRKDK